MNKFTGWTLDKMVPSSAVPNRPEPSPTAPGAKVEPPHKPHTESVSRMPCTLRDTGTLPVAVTNQYSAPQSTEQTDDHRNAPALSTQPNVRGFTELPVSELPIVIWRKIPRRAWSRRAEICYVLDPLPLGDGRFTTKVAVRLEAMNSLDPIVLTPAEHAALARALEEVQWQAEKARLAEQQRQANAAGRQILAVPSYLLPYDLQEAMCGGPSMLLSDTTVESATSPDATGQQPALFDTCCLVRTDVANDDDEWQMVYLSRFADRLSGARSGSIYTAWMLKEHLERGTVWDRDVERLEAHELRQVVNARAVSVGATPPVVIEPDSDYAAFARLTLEETCGLVPVKDPVFLRKEDVEGVDGEAAAILERAVAAIERQQAELREQSELRGAAFALAQTDGQRRAFLEAQLETNRDLTRYERLKCLLEEAEIWWSSQRGRKFNTLCLSPVFEEIEVPALTPKGRVRQSGGQPVTRWERQHTGYLLVVGMPTAMPLPWCHLKDLLTPTSHGVKAPYDRQSAVA